MTWLVKNEDGHYLTEATPGSSYWHEKQCFAKRFTDQGAAYRVAMKWCAGDGRVVRLKPGGQVPCHTCPDYGHFPCRTCGVTSEEARLARLQSGVTNGTKGTE